MLLRRLGAWRFALRGATDVWLPLGQSRAQAARKQSDEAKRRSCESTLSDHIFLLNL
jgi:hypothetical protein